MRGALAATLLRLASAPRARRFARALQDCRAAQAATLARIVRAAAATDYARQCGLAAADGASEFRRKVPICTYADIAGWVARQQQQPGRAAIAPGRVRCYEPTSGSGGTVKPIAYNAALLASFRSLFAIWAHDLLSHQLRLRSGRCFISVSPSFGAARGLADDRDYLGRAQRLLAAGFLLTPPQGCSDMTGFRRGLALALLRARDLEVVSIWNPGYLLVVLDEVERREPDLLQQLPALQRRILQNDANPWPQLWPQLQLVSCWTGAAAALPARQLAQRLPQARLQGKGLLATEAPVTLPLCAAGGCVPLLDEVFLEFETADGDCRLLHELDDGGEYALLLTQAGGLLRYRLGDRVRVGGRYLDVPLLEFIGRADAVADLVGEKLDEAFVATVLAEVCAAAGFASLLPLQPEQGRPFYLCLTDVADSGMLADRLDQALRQSLRYAEARALGQLAPVQVFAARNLRERVQAHWLGLGMSWGDIKDRSLLTDLSQAQRLHAALQRDQRSER